MRLRRRTMLRTLAILLVTAVLGTALAARSGMGWLRTPAAWAASRAVGAPVAIGTPFTVRPGSVTRIEINDLHIGSGDRGTLSVRAARLIVAIRLSSLLRGRPDLPLLRLEHARVVLPAPTDAETPRGRSSPAVVPRLRDALVEDLRLTRNGDTHGKGLHIHLEHGRILEDDSGILHILLEGNAFDAPLKIDGRIGPFDAILSGEPTRQDLHFRAGSVRGWLRGATVSLATLVGSDLDLEIRGRHIEEVFRLLSVSGVLPGRIPGASGPFSLHAAIDPAGNDGLALEASFDSRDGNATIRGTVRPGTPPALDLAVTARAPDAAALSGLIDGPRLPAAPLELSGTVRGQGFPITLPDLHVSLGTGHLDVSGTIGGPPDLVGTDLDIRLDIPEEGRPLLDVLPGPVLPPGAITARTRLSVSRRALTIGGLVMGIGNLRLTAEGTVPNRSSAFGRGSSLVFEASGPGLDTLGGLAGIPLPPLPFELSGRIAGRRDGLALERLAGRLGPDTFTATGLIQPRNGLAGSRLAATATGPDPRVLAGLIGLRGTPSGAYRASATLRLDEDALVIEPLDATIGRHTIRGSVRVSRSGRDRSVLTRLDAASGKDASELEGITGLKCLPRTGYTVTGTVRTAPGSVRLTGLAARVGGIRIVIRRGLIDVGGAGTLSLDLEGSGGNLATIGRIVGLGGLPTASFALHGHVGRKQTGRIVFEPLEGRIGRTELHISGFVDRPSPGWRLDLETNARGDDPDTLLAVLSGLGVTGLPATLPDGPYEIGGRFGHGPDGISFHGVSSRFGPITVDANGLLGRPPAFRDTRLALRGRAPGPFRIPDRHGGTIATLEGASFDLELRPGQPADGVPLVVHGRFGVARATLGTPAASPEAAGDREAPRTAAPTPGPDAEDGRPPDDHRFLIPDSPIRRAPPGPVGLDLRVEAGEIVSRHARFGPVHAELRWTARELTVRNLAARSAAGGTLEGSLLLETTGETAQLHAEARIRDLPVDLSRGRVDAADHPNLDLRLEIMGSGVSPHDIASRSRGRVSVVIGPGRVDGTLLDTLGDSVLVQLVEAMNPFHTVDPVTDLECLTAVARIEDGIVTLDPMGLKTAHVVSLGSGTLDLSTETLDIALQTKARRGIGLSVSTVTDAFVKVGGTLSRPALRFRPVRAAATTGLAVVTGGFSILAKGLWNRLSSEADVCGSLDAAVGELWTEPPDADPPGTPIPEEPTQPPRSAGRSR